MTINFMKWFQLAQKIEMIINNSIQTILSLEQFLKVEIIEKKIEITLSLDFTN